MWKIGKYLRELAEAKEKNKWITLRTDIPLNGDEGNNFYEFTMNRKITSGLDGSYMFNDFGIDFQNETLELRTETYDGVKESFFIKTNNIVMIRKEN